MGGFAVTIGALLIFLLTLRRLDWAALAVAVAAGAALTVYEARLDVPFPDVRLLTANGALTRTYLRTFGLFLVTYVLLYGFTQWLEAARGLDVTAAGLVMLPMSAVAGLVAVPLARSRRLWPALLAAALFALAGSAALLLLSSASPLGLVIAVTVVFGVTDGATYSGNQAALYLAAPPDRAGTASGLFGTATYLGATGGLHVVALALTGLSAGILALTLVEFRRARSVDGGSGDVQRGLVVSELTRARFTRMQDGTAEEYAVIAAAEADAAFALPQRVLDAVRDLDDGGAAGYAVTRLEHSLQSATRAERDGRPVDYVVAALIHDIGDGLAPYSHGSYAAAVLRPFVSEELCWIVSHHPLFQMYYYAPNLGGDPTARDRFADHPWYAGAVEFCERYDENCFDPDYDWLPLEHFAPAVESVFRREPAFR